MGKWRKLKKIINAYNQSWHNYGIIKYGYGGCVHFCKLYVITNESGMSVYLTEGKATLYGENKSINITAGECATILSNGSITIPKS